MKKIVYIIPGYTESYTSRSGYKKVTKLFKEKDIKVIFVDIHWKRNSPERFTDYTKDFLSIYKKPKNTKVYIFGFSYGAMVAFLTATKTKPDALMLCSLSPYFEEDFKNLEKEWLQSFRENFTKSDYSFNKLAPKIKTQTYILAGDQEHKSLLTRARGVKKLIENSTLFITKGAKHDIGQKEYLETIKKVISKL